MTEIAFKGATAIKESVYRASAPSKMAAWVGLCNNCNVIGRVGGKLLICATTFDCEFIARDGGFTIYKSSRHGYYFVDGNRSGMQFKQ